MKCGVFEKVYTAQADVEVLNEAAPDFFWMTRDALMENVLLALCRLTDPPSVGKNQNLCIGQLAIHPEVAMVPELATQVSAFSEVARQATAFARIRRDKCLAHRDLPHALRVDDNAMSTYTRRDVAAAMCAIAEVLNVIQQHRTGDDVCFGDVSGFGDSHLLFQHLRAGLASERERRRSLGIPEDNL